jgi:predicted XRE-type DNA-binding protein
VKKKYDNVWFALEANDADAINMTLRSDLMTSIERSVATWNLSQSEAAKRLGITRHASMTCCAGQDQ